MISASPQTNTWFCGVKAGSQLIRYSFSWLLRVPLSVTLLTHTAVRLSQPSFIPYIQLRRPDTICSSVLYICAAPWHHVEFSRWFWSENPAASVCERPHELTTDIPELKWVRKGLQRSWIMGHMAWSLFIQFRCQWRLWLSFWSELRCTFNLQGLGCRGRWWSRSYAGVTAG